MFKTLLFLTSTVPKGHRALDDLLPSFESSQKKELGSLLKEHEIDLSTRSR